MKIYLSLDDPKVLDKAINVTKTDSHNFTNLFKMLSEKKMCYLDYQEFDTIEHYDNKNNKDTNNLYDKFRNAVKDLMLKNDQLLPILQTKSPTLRKWQSLNFDDMINYIDIDKNQYRISIYLNDSNGWLYFSKN